MTLGPEPFDLTRIVSRREVRLQFCSHDCPYTLGKALDRQSDLAVEALLLVGIDTDFGGLTRHEIDLLIRYSNLAHVGNLLPQQHAVGEGRVSVEVGDVADLDAMAAGNAGVVRVGASASSNSGISQG